MRRLQQEAQENGLPDPFEQHGLKDEAGRFGVYAKDKKKPLALFESREEAEEFLGQAGQMIAYMVAATVKGEKTERSFVDKKKAEAWAKRHMGSMEPTARFAGSADGFAVWIAR